MARLQKRIYEVALLRIVYGERGSVAKCRSHIAVAVQSARYLSEGSDDSVVLTVEGLQRMSRCHPQLHRSVPVFHGLSHHHLLLVVVETVVKVMVATVIVGLVMEERGMYVAQLLHLADRLSLADELLLRAHNVVGRHITELSDEVGADALHRLTLVDAPEQCLYLLRGVGSR